MAKKAVATFKKGDGRTYSKVIKMDFLFICYILRYFVKSFFLLKKIFEFSIFFARASKKGCRLFLLSFP